MYKDEPILYSFRIFSGLTNPISKTIYMRSNKQVDKLSEFLNYAMELTLPLMMVPLFIFSFVTYLWNDMDNDAFQLAFFQWYLLENKFQI